MCNILHCKCPIAYFWHCSHSMRSRVYEMFGRPSVPSFASCCGGFAAERRAGRRYWSTVAGSPAAAVALQHGTQQQIALSSKCKLCRVYNWCRKLNTDLFVIVCVTWVQYQIALVCWLILRCQSFLGMKHAELAFSAHQLSSVVTVESDREQRIVWAAYSALCFFCPGMKLVVASIL